MENVTALSPAQDKQTTLNRMFKSLRGKITGIFEPQEVEVTFEGEGKNVRYTYTKVGEKQVA